MSTIVGLDTRATMDLDMTIKGFTLMHEAIRKIFTKICAVQIADDYSLRLSASLTFGKPKITSTSGSR